jgi:hypothetical protein
LTPGNDRLVFFLLFENKVETSEENHCFICTFICPKTQPHLRGENILSKTMKYLSTTTESKKSSLKYG